MKTSRIAAACAATAILALGTVVAGCGSSDSSSASVPSDVPRDAAFAEVYSSNGDGEASMTAIVGGTFVVKLDCSPGTGYEWRVKTSGDTVLGEWKTTGCETGEGTTSAVGASGFETRTYDVKTAGTEKLAFRWMPPGKDTPAVTQTISLTAS
jgi:predicted secreted protein